MAHTRWHTGADEIPRRLAARDGLRRRLVEGGGGAWGEGGGNGRRNTRVHTDRHTPAAHVGKNAGATRHSAAISRARLARCLGPPLVRLATLSPYPPTAPVARTLRDKFSREPRGGDGGAALANSRAPGRPDQTGDALVAATWARPSRRSQLRLIAAPRVFCSPTTLGTPPCLGPLTRPPPSPLPLPASFPPVHAAWPCNY